MAFQSVPDTAEITLNYTAFGVALANVLHAHKSGGYTLSDLDTLAATVDDWVNDTWRPLMPTTTTYVNTVVTGLEQANDLQVTVNTSAGVGGAATQGVANNITKAFKLASSFTGRSARGRLFFPGIPGGATDANFNHVTQTFVDDVIDAINALIALLDAIGWIVSIVSRISNGVKRSQGVNFDVAGVSVVDLTTDSARGRMVLS